MSKIEFFNDLEKFLKAFEIPNIDEILRDYEEYFIESAQVGKTEQEIIESLGNPVEIAMSYHNKDKNRNVGEEKKIVNYNIKVVTGNCIMYTLALVLFAIASVVMFVLTQSVTGFILMLVMDIGFLVLAILEFKKLKKYKNAQKDLKNLNKKDI